MRLISSPSGEPDCLRCVHYYITHEARFPYGCRAMAFKSKRLPMQEVLATSGTPCLMFEPRRQQRR